MTSGERRARRIGRAAVGDDGPIPLPGESRLHASRLIATLLCALLIASGCKEGDSGASPTAPAASTGVRAICQTVGLGGTAGTLVGTDECANGFDFPSQQTCDFVPVGQSFSVNCQGVNVDCGADFSTRAEGTLDVSPGFDAATGLLTSVAVRASVSAEFQGNLGTACGQTGNSVGSSASAQVEIEVVDEPVTARISGTLALDSTGLSTPFFRLFLDGSAVVEAPQTNQPIAASVDLQPGTHTLQVVLTARPSFNAGPSSGRFSLSLAFE